METEDGEVADDEDDKKGDEGNEKGTESAVTEKVQNMLSTFVGVDIVLCNIGFMKLKKSFLFLEFSEGKEYC